MDMGARLREAIDYLKTEHPDIERLDIRLTSSTWPFGGDYHAEATVTFSKGVKDGKEEGQ